MVIYQNFLTKKIKKVSWFACTVEGAKIIYSKNLSASDTKLLFYLLSKINEENRVLKEKNKIISENLSLKESTVKKSMMKLRELDIIIKDMGVTKTLIVNALYFYAGDYKLKEDKEEYFKECKKEYNKKHKKRKEALNKTLEKNGKKLGRKKIPKENFDSLWEEKSKN